MEKKDIAVIGGGIAGLSCGWLLSQQHNVTLFEQQNLIGMDASSIDVNLSQLCPSSITQEKNIVRVDVPLRVFSVSYYPNLTNLYSSIVSYNC
jgi:predicted NAD/FAD-binding protein